jgi:hypothetical protein
MKDARVIKQYWHNNCKHSFRWGKHFLIFGSLMTVVTALLTLGTRLAVVYENTAATIAVLGVAVLFSLIAGYIVRFSDDASSPQSNTRDKRASRQDSISTSMGNEKYNDQRKQILSNWEDNKKFAKALQDLQETEDVAVEGTAVYTTDEKIKMANKNAEKVQKWTKEAQDRGSSRLLILLQNMLDNNVSRKTALQWRTNWKEMLEVGADTLKIDIGEAIRTEQHPVTEESPLHVAMRATALIVHDDSTEDSTKVRCSFCTTVLCS